MKNVIMFSALIILSSCGKEHDSPIVVNPPAAQGTTINAVYSNGTLTLDLRSIIPGQSTDSQQVISCDGSYGNSGMVNGTSEGQITTQGSLTAGSVQFGHTKYVGASNPACRDLSKEAYTYSVSGDILTLCNVAYNQCSNFNRMAN